MKRAVGLILIIFACVAGFLTIWENILFIPVVVAIVLLAIFLYAKELSLGSRRLFRTVLFPVIEENYRANLVLAQRFEAIETALDKFADAMQLYAQHMVSHTSAIQGLSEASHELKVSAAEQNRILGLLAKTLVQERSERDVSTRVERVGHEFERRTLGALKAKEELEKRILVQELKPQEELEKRILVQELKPQEEPLLRAKVQSPPGCAVNPKALLTRTRS